MPNEEIMGYSATNFAETRDVEVRASGSAPVGGMVATMEVAGIESVEGANVGPQRIGYSVE